MFYDTLRRNALVTELEEGGPYVNACSLTVVVRFGLAVRRQAGKRTDAGSSPLPLVLLSVPCL